MYLLLHGDDNDQLAENAQTVDKRATNQTIVKLQRKQSEVVASIAVKVIQRSYALDSLAACFCVLMT